MESYLLSKRFFAMSSQTRFDHAYRNAPRISFNDQSKFILFSDCHQGTIVLQTILPTIRNIYFHALKLIIMKGLPIVNWAMGTSFGKSGF